MSKARFTQADISRAVAGAKKAGLDLTGMEIAPDGTIRLLATDPKPAQGDEREPQQW